MCKLAINDLPETTELDRVGMAEIRGGFIVFGFAGPSTSGSSSKHLKLDGIDGESTDDKHQKWIESP